MELLQLKYFKVLAQTENITKASQLLFVAQPSLSQMLKRLEEELGTPLFDRIGKKIVLNDAGRILLRYCERILQDIDNARTEIDEYKGSLVSNINIAVDSASLLIPDIIHNIRESYPKIMPRIFQDICDDWDLKIYSDHTPQPHSILLSEERIGVVLPKNHPLREKERIFAKDLFKYGFIELGPSHNLHRITKELCKTHSFPINTIMTVDSPAMLRDLVKMNLGIAFIPEITWKPFINDGLEFRIVSDMPMKRYVQLQLNNKKHLTKAARCCKIVITEYFEEYTRKFR